MAAKNDPLLTRSAVEAIAPWLRGEVDQTPARALLADACRRTARTLAAELPGHSVELRVPPFVAVQCVDGPRHTRGTPPNVVECDAETWLRLAAGLSTLEEEIAQGRVDVSGSRAGEVAAGLPVIALERG
ncbi:sterol carrier family protein [Corynebacterium sp. LK2510]|uniref:sterol carrier family protein n=1 Tax=Corynebacterium sp. LK2510 TaxID=3110472 RepID=UPI0034CF69E6